MMKYNEPKMYCRLFAAESIVTESSTVKSSTERVVDKLKSKGISENNIMYATMSN